MQAVGWATERHPKGQDTQHPALKPLTPVAVVCKKRERGLGGDAEWYLEHQGKYNGKVADWPEIQAMPIPRDFRVAASVC